MSKSARAWIPAFVMLLGIASTARAGDVCETTETIAFPPVDAIRDGQYGRAVAMDGDIAVISATEFFQSGANTGAAYVYQADGIAWIEVDELRPSDGSPSDNFGTSVSIDGDVILVGATRHNSHKGAAYVFRRNAMTGDWEEEQKLEPGPMDTGINGNMINNFGTDVAISGDVAVVGTIQRGTAYVFRYDGSVWNSDGILRRTDDGGASCGCSFDTFGGSVAVDADTILIGAPQFSQPGSAHVFTYDNGSMAWSRVAQLTASDGANDDAFGNSVAINGSTAMVGAYKDDNPETDSGSVYAFLKPDSGWVNGTETQKLSPDVPEQWGGFGRSLAIAGEIALVGATPNAVDTGSAYLFVRAGGVWELKARFGGLGSSSQDIFGGAVALNGAMGLIGAPGDDRLAPAYDAGRAYFFAGMHDCDANTVPDICDVHDCESTDPSCMDCNNNGALDICDLTNLVSTDDLPLAGDGIPDECQSDCNANDIPDATDIFDGTSDDLLPPDGDDIPDECQDVCGDGLVNAMVGEGCDDGNLDLGDGCDDLCAIEPGFLCDNSTFTSDCRDADECAGENKGHDCDPHAICTNTVGSFTCACPEGFTGDGLTCDDLDECVGEGIGHDCVEPHVTCVNVPGSFQCVCEPGYIGDGHSCADANECIGEGGGHNCDINATCTNTEGGFACACNNPFVGDGLSCACDAGYHVDGNTCSDDDECIGEGLGHNCDLNATCTNTEGSFSCACNTGFIGDGSSCICPSGFHIAGSYCVDDNECIGQGSGNPCGLDDTCVNVPGAVLCEDPLCTVNGPHGLPPVDPLAGAGFGYEVAIDGDWAAVAAYEYFDIGPDIGAVHFFKADGADWIYDQTIEPSDGVAEDFFGSAIALKGDLLIVGATNHNQVKGAAYIYRRDDATGTWEEEQKLEPGPSDTGINGYSINWFGTDVAIEGDVAVVGTGQRGTAYVYRFDGSVWNLDTRLHRTDNGGTPCGCSFDYFGASVTIDGGTILVGAPQYQQSGGVYVYEYDNDTSNWNRVAKLRPLMAGIDDAFGHSVALHGGTALIGAYQDDDGGSNAGAVYFFDKPAGGWADTGETQKIISTEPLASDWFGYSVAIHDDLAVVGIAPNAFRVGKVFLFSRDGGVWTVDYRLQGRDPIGRDFFGYAVAMDGDRAIVGGFGNDQLSPGINAGSAYLFTGLIHCGSNSVNNLCTANGDYDLDGDADLTDYASLVDCMGGAGASPSPADAACLGTCLSTFDSDGDGKIDLRDVADFLIDSEP